jgi:protoporphyrinogen oxidase
MMWERCREQVEAAGTKVVLDARVVAIEHQAGHATAVITETDGARPRYPATHVISSMPISALLAAMTPAPPDEVLAAARGLRYRDFLTVALVVPASAAFEDNWIYVHAPEVQLGRIQNFGSWSPYLVKEGRTCLGLEYFVNEGDELWEKPDDELVAFATAELARIGLVPAHLVEAGYVVRMPKAYPVYDEMYQGNVEMMRKWLAANTPNVFPCGRNGMHKYNNQDHSMLTAMLSVENILGADHDVWSVNVEAEYHEHAAGDDGSRPPGDGYRVAARGQWCARTRTSFAGSRRAACPSPPPHQCWRSVGRSASESQTRRRAARDRRIIRNCRLHDP